MTLCLHVIPFKVISIRSYTLLCMSFAGIEGSCKRYFVKMIFICLVTGWRLWWHFSGSQQKVEHITDRVLCYICMPLGWLMHTMKQLTQSSWNTERICLQLGRMPTQQLRQLMSSQRSLKQVWYKHSYCLSGQTVKWCGLVVPVGTLAQKYPFPLYKLFHD
jgi:hypothetical protein